MFEPSTCGCGGVDGEHLRIAFVFQGCVVYSGCSMHNIITSYKPGCSFRRFPFSTRIGIYELIVVSLHVYTALRHGNVYSWYIF